MVCRVRIAFGGICLRNSRQGRQRYVGRRYCTARVNVSGRLTGVVAPAGVNAAVTVSEYVPVGVPACGVTCAPEPLLPHDVSATAASSTKTKTDATAMRFQTRRRTNPAAHSAAIVKT